MEDEIKEFVNSLGKNLSYNQLCLALEIRKGIFLNEDSLYAWEYLKKNFKEVQSDLLKDETKKMENKIEIYMELLELYLKDLDAPMPTELPAWVQ